MSSFLKYQENKDVVAGNGRGPLSFSRAHVDKMPFRGAPPMLREEEYEQCTEVVRDACVSVFDLSDPTHKAQYQEVIDRSVNGWYMIHRIQEKLVDQADGSMKVFVYCVYSAPHRELNKSRAPKGVDQQPRITRGQ